MPLSLVSFRKGWAGQGASGEPGADGGHYDAREHRGSGTQGDRPDPSGRTADSLGQGTSCHCFIRESKQAMIPGTGLAPAPFPQLLCLPCSERGPQGTLPGSGSQASSLSQTWLLSGPGDARRAWALRGIWGWPHCLTGLPCGSGSVHDGGLPLFIRSQPPRSCSRDGPSPPQTTHSTNAHPCGGTWPRPTCAKPTALILNQRHAESRGRSRIYIGGLGTRSQAPTTALVIPDLCGGIAAQ